jgi:hypothetical protein
MRHDSVSVERRNAAVDFSLVKERGSVTAAFVDSRSAPYLQAVEASRMSMTESSNDRHERVVQAAVVPVFAATDPPSCNWRESSARCSSHARAVVDARRSTRASTRVRVRVRVRVTVSVTTSRTGSRWRPR